MRDPERATLAALVIAGLVLGFRAAQSGNLRPSIYVPYGVVALVILGVAAFAPELGAALAILVLVVLLLGDAEMLARGQDRLYSYLAGPKSGKKP